MIKPGGRKIWIFEGGLLVVGLLVLLLTRTCS
jgi:hypothetical protein